MVSSRAEEVRRGKASATQAEEEPPGAAINQCIALLRSNVDERRFVGLLLATQHMGSLRDMALVLEASHPFLQRLLRSPSEGEAEGSKLDSSPYSDFERSGPDLEVPDISIAIFRDYVRFLPAENSTT